MTRISKLRSPGSFRRRAGKTLPRSITLIVCEGETEQEYLRAARIRYELTTAEIILAENTKGSAPISVVECAKEKSEEPGSYDKIYCVFDRNSHPSFDKARQTIRILANRKKKPLPIEEAISIPCFEVWVLLHFERTDAPFDCCANVIDRVRNHLPGYEKADSAIARQLIAHVDTAVENAAWLEARAANNDDNPYTSVQQILRHFKTVAGQGTP